jgi:hypothetical protein
MVSISEVIEESGLKATDRHTRAGEGLEMGRNRHSVFELSVFHHNAGDDVGSFIAAIGGIAQMTVNLAHLEHIDRIRSFEEICQG